MYNSETQLIWNAAHGKRLQDVDLEELSQCLWGLPHMTSADYIQIMPLLINIVFTHRDDVHDSLDYIVASLTPSWVCVRRDKVSSREHDQHTLHASYGNYSKTPSAIQPQNADESLEWDVFCNMYSSQSILPELVDMMSKEQIHQVVLILCQLLEDNQFSHVDQWDAGIRLSYMYWSSVLCR